MLQCHLYIVLALKIINNWIDVMLLTPFFWSVVVFTLATQTWDKAPHWDGAGVEVFALVYLQIVIIVAPIAVSNGDSALVLDHKV